MSSARHLPLLSSAWSGVFVFPPNDLSVFLPSALNKAELDQTEIPRLAKDAVFLREIETSVQSVPTKHYLVHADARYLPHILDESVHLVLTSPPYWTLKRYDDSAGQMGHIAAYEEFLIELDRVWKRCYEALVPGGRLICVVGDICLSRRQNEGRHTVVPLHSAIQETCRKLGFDNLAPIIWHKIANAAYEAQGSGGGFLGKPYEPNSVIKNDIEYILMLRKPGGYRRPSSASRLLSVIGSENYQKWFQQIWSGLTGESTRHHPAPYPVDLAERLIRMFSFVGDIVLDPFSGTATTSMAAARWGRNSIGCEIQENYLRDSIQRLSGDTQNLFRKPEIVEVWEP